MAPHVKQQASRASAAGLAAVALMAWAATARAVPPSPALPIPDAAAAAKHTTPKPPLPPSGPPPCADGEPRDDSGACPVVDDAPATRGFELYSGALPPRGTRPAPVAQVETNATPAASSCGAQCDLKISFMAGSAALTRSAQTQLIPFAALLDSPALAAKRIEIAGHTDASGSPTHNLSLSRARAESVVRFLVAHGVPTARLTAKGYGAEGLALPDRPLDPRNRRVEALVLP